MLIVLGALALLGTIPMVVVSTVVGQQPLTASNLNWNAAYEAAQAGLNDYLQLVDAEASYTQWTSSSTELCQATGNPSRPYAPAPGGPGNDAFCGWASASGSTAPLSTNPMEWFEYRVAVTGGHVVLTVSGKAASGTQDAQTQVVVRTFQYQVAPASATLDDIYWTNSENQANCQSNCTIFFSSSDIINGPMFSNDTFHIDGNPTFNGPVVSAVDSANAGTQPPPPLWDCATSEAGPFSQPSPPTASTCGSPVIANPRFVDGISAGTKQDITTNGTSPDVAPAKALGCYLSVSNTAGNTVTMDLSSTTPTTLSWSGSGVSVRNDPSNPNGNACMGTSSGGVNTVTLSSLKAPIFYVNGNVDLNPMNAGTPVPGTMSGFLTLVATGNITVGSSITYPCAHISWVKGASCSGTNPTSEGTDTRDALGLIAGQNIELNASNLPVEIDAAMMAIGGSFVNNQWTQSCPSTCNTLTVFGSIAQDNRGPVGTIGSNGTANAGYGKDYVYDQALQTLWPPFFIAPAGMAWVPRTYTELPAGPAKEAVPGT